MVDVAISSAWWKRMDWGWSQSDPTILSEPTLRSNSIHPNPSFNSILSDQYLRFHPETSICLKQLAFACTDKGYVLRSTASKHLWHVVLPCPHTSRLLQPPFPIPINWAVQFTLQAKARNSSKKWNDKEEDMWGGGHCTLSQIIRMQFTHKVLKRGGWGWFIWGGGGHCNSLRGNFKFTQKLYKIRIRIWGWGWFIWGVGALHVSSILSKNKEDEDEDGLYEEGGIARRLTRSHRKRHMSPQVYQPAPDPRVAKV